MAPFEWLTPHRVLKAWGGAVGLLLLGVGSAQVYLALVFPTAFTLFGVNGYLLLGLAHVIGGLFFLLSEYKRPPLTATDTD